jgi:hypothetical protein
VQIRFQYPHRPVSSYGYGCLLVREQDFQDAISSIQRCKQPVIAAIHGNAVGLAIDIASACDVRLAASDVTFGIFVRPIRSSSSYSYLHMPLDLELVRYKRNTGRC